MIKRLLQSSKTIVLSIFLLSLFFGKFLVSPLQAAVGINETINFQGKLHDSSNLNVADSTYTVVFKLYDASSGGSELWTETQSVTTTDGVFRVALGSVSSISGVDFNSDSLYLSIKVGADAEMTPRIRFTAVPYAFQAKSAANVKWSGLTAPTANLALSMSSYTSTFTYGATTGSSNLFNLTDTTSNTGTGYLLNLTTASGSTLKPFHVSAAGTEALLVDASGNVGVGVTTVNRKLEVNQSMRLSHASTVLSEFYVSGNAADNRNWDFRADASGFTGNAWNDAGSVNGQWLLVKRSGSTVSSVNFPNGSVGVGNSNPSALFSVGSTSQFQINSAGAIAAATGITSSGSINFSGLSASSVVYTDASKNLTTTAPTSGAVGYWSRSGTTLSPTASSDSVSLAGGSLTVGTNGLSLIVGDGTNVAAGINIASNRAMVGYDGSNAVIQGGTTKGIKFNVNNASFGSGTAMTLDSTGNLTLIDGLTSLTSSSTTASSKALSVSQTGATAGTDYSGYFTNTGAATTNVGLYASATGATNNYAAIFENGNIGIGDTSPVSALTVGSGDLFQVNSSGDIVKINNITYSFPSSQAAGSGYVLSNNGSGTLTWTDINTGGSAGPWTLSGNNLYPDSSSYSVGIGGITAPSRALEVNQGFRISHASTTLSEMNISGNAADNRIWDFRGDATGFTGNAWNDAGSVNGQWLRVTRTGTTINTTSFPTGNVSIGTNNAAAKLYSLATSEQLRLGYDAGNFTSFTVNSGGDLNLTPSGGDITISGTLTASGNTGIIISGASSTTTGSATTYGGSFTAAGASTSGIGFLYGINSSTTLSGSGGASNAGGARIFAQTTGSAPAWVDMLGTDITVQAGVTTNSLQGTKISLINASSATIPIVYGVNIANITNATGTITNTYGMYVGDITTGTQTNTPFSFYASDANAYNYFAGNVGVGAVPSSGYKLHVAGGNAIVAQTATSALITIESSATGAAYDARSLHLVSASNTTGHAYTEFRAGSTRAWSFGMDRADSDKLKISLGTSFALPGAGDVMTFDTSSNVGIGTSSLSNKFTVTDTGTTNVAKFNGSASTQCTVVTGTGWSCSSDERLKDNITDISGSLDKLQNIRTVTYNWKNGGDPTKQIGFIAQNVEQYYPELVRTDESGYKSVLYAQFTPLIIQGMKEQQGQILGNASTISNLTLSTNNLTTVQSTQSATLSTLQTEIDTIKTQLTSVTATINNLISTIDSNTDAIASLISRLDYIKPINGAGKLDQMEERLAFLENNAYASGSGSTNGGQVLGATSSGNLVYQDQTATIAALIVTGESNLNELSVMGEANIGLIAVDGIEGSIDALGSPLKLQTTATGPLQIMANKVEFTQSGNVQIKQGDLEIQQGVIKVNNKVRDVVTLNSGQTTIAVTGMAWSNAPVTITANASYDSYVWITDITADGFTINVKNAPSSDQKVYWQGLW